MSIYCGRVLSVSDGIVKIRRFDKDGGGIDFEHLFKQRGHRVVIHFHPLLVPGPILSQEETKRDKISWDLSLRT